MRTDELIIRLAGSAGPVEPLAPPIQRLARWAAAGATLMVVGVAVVGARRDVMAMTHQVTFLTTAVLTGATALIAAGAALVLGVPGAERSAVQRWAPLAACASWATLLTVLLVSSGSAGTRIAAFPFHVACGIEIPALALIPGWGLFVMLRRAEPLRPAWAGGLAALGALHLAAVATQIICPVDDPAHLLVGHVLPVAALALAGAAIGRRTFTHPPLSPK